MAKKNVFTCEILTLILFFTLFALTSFAQEGFDMSVLHDTYQDPASVMAQDTQFGAGNQENMGIVLLRIVGSLALVLGVLAAVAWGVRKSGIFGHSANATAQTPSMNVLEALATGQGGVVLLLRCEKQVFLIGQTASTYTLLREFSEEDALKIIESKGGLGNISAFKNSLANFMQTIKVQQVPAAKTPNVSGRKI